MADAAAGVSSILKLSAARRHPYARAADEVELAVTADKLAKQHTTLLRQLQPQLPRHNGVEGVGGDHDDSEL